MAKRNEAEKEQPKGTLFVTPLEEVLPASMLPYAEEVIMERALPRVEDGLKPVQRRILYTMSEMGLTPDKPHKKSARIVGDCMGKYHPHGDSSVYDAMVRMAQDFNMGRTLVNGHGNFGSVDGDPAAAMRYTEARLEPLALELLRDLDKNTVPFSLNFDDSLKEPRMLPGRFPNLLVNGASGIAVGLATNIPPHNLSEVIDGIVAFIDRPKMKLEELMNYIPAPDFPTGGYVIASEVKQAYATGKGRVILRAKVRVEEGDGDKRNIVIYELPYQVNKSNLLRKIAELREEKKEEFEGVLRVVDESDRAGMRAVIEINGNCDVNKTMKLLYKYTDLEISFGLNMVAIAGGKPQTLGLLSIVRYYALYQREVVVNRTKFDLAQAKERCHILEGLIVAVRNIDEVIKIIKKAESTADAREKLRKRFELSERQAQAILDLRLARLTKLEVFKLEEELKALKKLIEELTAILGSVHKQDEIVKAELLEIKKKYHKSRRSELVYTLEAAGPQRDDVRAPGMASIVAISAEGRLKCMPEKNFNMSNKAVGEKTKKASILVWNARMLSDEQLLVFSDKGNVYRTYADRFACKFTEPGATLSELFEDAEKGEKPVAVFRDGITEGNVLFITEKGMLKKTAWTEYIVPKNCFQGIRLNEGDKLLAVQTDAQDDDATVFFVTKKGMCLNAKKDDIPLQGRVAGGVKGINLNDGDAVVWASQVDSEEGEVVAAFSDGRYKRVIVGTVSPLPRYRKGVQIASLKGAEVLFADYVTVPYMLAVLKDDGALCEIATEDVPIDATSTRGRPLKGVKWTAKEVYAMKYRESDD